MKLYADYVTIDFNNKVELNKELKIESLVDNYKNCFIDCTKDFITITGEHIVLYYQSRLCDELNYNKNNIFNLSDIDDKYLKTKRRFFIGKKYKIIKDGWFELKHNEKKIIKSDCFTICNLYNGIILDDDDKNI